MSPPPTAVAGQPTFTASVSYANTAPLKPEVRKGVTVPVGVEARQPTFCTLADIVRVQQARALRFDYAKPADLNSLAVGFTDTNLTVSFTDLAASWRREGDMWHFLGGEIQLALTIGIYVDERASKPARLRCLQLIMTHELQHARDEIDIVKNHLPTAALGDAFVRANLSPQARVPQSRFDESIRGTGNGNGSSLERRIQRELYIIESSGRALALHNSHPRDSELIGKCMK